MTIYIEDNLPNIRDNGLNTLENVEISGSAVFEASTAVPASAGAVAAGAPITLFSNGPSIYVTQDLLHQHDCT